MYIILRDSLFATRNNALKCQGTVALVQSAMANPSRSSELFLNPPQGGFFLVFRTLAAPKRSRAGKCFPVAPRYSLGEKHFPARSLGMCLSLPIAETGGERHGPRGRAKAGFSPSEYRGANGKPAFGRTRWPKPKPKPKPGKHPKTEYFYNVPSNPVISDAPFLCPRLSGSGRLIIKP